MNEKLAFKFRELSSQFLCRLLYASHMTEYDMKWTKNSNGIRYSGWVTMKLEYNSILIFTGGCHWNGRYNTPRAPPTNFERKELITLLDAIPISVLNCNFIHLFCHLASCTGVHCQTSISNKFYILNRAKLFI